MTKTEDHFMRLINWLRCQIQGHNWKVQFWETKCKRCGKVKQDRIYQLIDTYPLKDIRHRVGKSPIIFQRPCQFCETLDKNSLGGDYCWNCGRNLRI